MMCTLYTHMLLYVHDRAHTCEKFGVALEKQKGKKSQKKQRGKVKNRLELVKSNLYLVGKE